MTTTKINTNTGPGDPQWEAWTLERTRDAIEQIDPTRTTQQAFLIVVRDRIFKSGRLDDFGHCSRVIREMIRTGELPLKLEIQQALSDAWSASIYQRFEAGDRQILEEALGGGLVDIADAQSLLEIIQRLGQQQNWPLNPEGERQRQEQRAAEHRQRLIARIADGKSTYPVWSKIHGQFRWLPVNALHIESESILEQLAEVVPQWREQLSTNRKQERKTFSDSLGNDVARVR